MKVWTIQIPLAWARPEKPGDQLTDSTRIDREILTGL